jgi:glycerol-3-phosphate dehydrogenase
MGRMDASHNLRRQQLGHAGDAIFDVAIIGGGVNGACLYHRLCAAGYRVLLVDRSDFAASSSQTSGMMIWGGLLYLSSLDFSSVYFFSKTRDLMLQTLADRISLSQIRYIPSARHGRNRHFVHAGLFLYWLLGQCRRSRPVFQSDFAELPLVRAEHDHGSLLYEEGLLNISDCRFALDWIAPHQSPEHVPLNYCAVVGSAYNTGDRLWYLRLHDVLGNHQTEARSRWVVNCAGVWVDTVNRMAGIETPYKHVLSKGVYVGVTRPPEHTAILAFETGYEGDVVTYVPWGPISMLGPTETRCENVDEGYRTRPEDLRFLLEQAERHLSRPPAGTDIISMRSGLRALAVPKSFNRDGYTLGLSRRHYVVADRGRPWLSLYGGKITGCVQVAEAIAARIDEAIPAAARPAPIPAPAPTGIEFATFPGLAERWPSVQWCMEHEFCYTLEDYLRRRTNIAQWVAREGLGQRDEHLPAIERVALTLHHGDTAAARSSVDQYREQVHARFDSVVSRI